MRKYKVFVSSVQKEMELERLAVSSLIITDPFLSEHLEPVLFDKEPISGQKATRPYLNCLVSCQVYILLMNREYGQLHGSLSATHHEYRHAQKRGMPSLIFVKGRDDSLREEKTLKFFSEIKSDGYTYKRFDDRLDLRIEVRRSLIRILDQEFGITPTEDESKSGMDTLEAASPFETAQTEVSWSQLDYNVAKEWLTKIGDISGKKAQKPVVLNHLRTRGMLWREQESGDYLALAAGILFFGINPSSTFPHCRILVDAYRGNETDPNPEDQITISGPAPVAVQTVIDFVNKNTRHPPRIVGLNRIALDEYPVEAVREAIVNAIAHRNYEDRSRSIMVEVFFDRVVISSPGLPPRPLTLAKLRRGKYRPCSRNPVLAQSMALLKLMEQRGSGLGRMKSAMLDHGLEIPEFDISDGYFQVILKGPGENMDRLRVPASAVQRTIPPSVEEQLNERQKKMYELLIRGHTLTSRFCEKMFDISRPTAASDFSLLVSLGLARIEGKGRSTRYVLETHDNR
ncbi:MAG: ATP-binding protein [Pseudomonadota bacterium]